MHDGTWLVRSARVEYAALVFIGFAAAACAYASSPVGNESSVQRLQIDSTEIGPSKLHPWQPTRANGLVQEAREKRLAGHLDAAEQECRALFVFIEDSVVDAYDAYASQLESQLGTDAVRVREQAVRLRGLQASRASATRPTSNYLGFSPEEGLLRYATVETSMGHSDAAAGLTTLALAYRQEQVAQVRRTLLFRKGQDPREAC